MSTLNEVFSSMTARRRYEVWFLRMGLADGSGAWWFRYLFMNPGREGCAGNPGGAPAQVWATWFPVRGKPRSFIQGFPLAATESSGRGITPFHLQIGANRIEEDFCKGALEVEGHAISWTLHYRSTFRATLSNKGWIGFSRTPHSDAVFDGEIVFDGRRFVGDPLGFGVQGHNCGYRHRNFWTWTHAYFPSSIGPATTLEALVYEMPLGLVFRKAVLWHGSTEHMFRSFRESNIGGGEMLWKFECSVPSGIRIEAAIDGSGASLHQLPYVKTDCSGSFEVANNSLASASLTIQRSGMGVEHLQTDMGAVLEIVGARKRGGS